MAFVAHCNFCLSKLSGAMRCEQQCAADRSVVCIAVVGACLRELTNLLRLLRYHARTAWSSPAKAITHFRSFLFESIFKTAAYMGQNNYRQQRTVVPAILALSHSGASFPSSSSARPICIGILFGLRAFRRPIDGRWFLKFSSRSGRKVSGSVSSAVYFGLLKGFCDQVSRGDLHIFVAISLVVRLLMSAWQLTARRLIWKSSYRRPLMWAGARQLLKERK